MASASFMTFEDYIRTRIESGAEDRNSSRPIGRRGSGWIYDVGQ